MSNPVFISFIKLKGNVIDNYKSSKSGWKSKCVAWEDMRKVMSNSKVQYSNFEWNNGYKTSDNFSMDKLTHLIWDIDDDFPIATFQKMFKKYKWVLGTTKSNMVDKKGLVCERYRVCMEVLNAPNDPNVFFRAISLIAPFVDEQTLTKTSAYLGNDNAIIIYNEGKPLDLFKPSAIATEQLKDEYQDKIAKAIDKDMISSYGKSNSIEDIKKELTFEIVVDILTSVGYEVKGNKFSVRDERTASCNINYKSLNIKDYGGDGYYGDIFDLLVEYQDMSLKEAVMYTQQFV